MLSGFDTYHGDGLFTPPMVAGKSFWLGKVSQGTTFVDPLFQQNRNWLRNYAPALVRFGYHYAGFNDPTAEANFFLNTFGIQPGEGTALDVEAPTILGQALIDWVMTFVTVVFQTTGKYPLVYMDLSLANAYQWAPVFNLCGPWIAAPSDPTGTVPVVYNVAMQQIGEVIYGGQAIDQDVAFMSESGLQAYATPLPLPPVPSAPSTVSSTPPPTVTPAAPVVQSSTPATPTSSSPLPVTTNTGTSIDIVVKPPVTKASSTVKKPTVSPAVHAAEVKVENWFIRLIKWLTT